MKKVVVDWVDSKGLNPDWEFKRDLAPLEPAHCRSVGFLMDEGDDYTTLVMTDSSDQVLGRLTIPKAAITKVRELR